MGDIKTVMNYILATLITLVLGMIVIVMLVPVIAIVGVMMILVVLAIMLVIAGMMSKIEAMVRKIVEVITKKGRRKEREASNLYLTAFSESMTQLNKKIFQVGSTAATSRQYLWLKVTEMSSFLFYLFLLFLFSTALLPPSFSTGVLFNFL